MLGLNLKARPRVDLDLHPPIVQAFQRNKTHFGALQNQKLSPAQVHIQQKGLLAQVLIQHVLSSLKILIRSHFDCRVPQAACRNLFDYGGVKDSAMKVSA